jgi:NAD dependent epimerase/dehydratase
MSWEGREVLVTGAGGFIGSHLVGRLADDGARVRAFVHYNSRNDWGNLRYLTPEQLAHVAVIMGNVEDSGSVDEAVAGCDCVLHLAALIGIPYSYTAPRSYVATNIVGTINVLDAVRRHGVPRVVHTSTSEAYGTAQYVPIDEEHPLQGQSPYSATKIGADKLAESYYRSFGVPVATIRPFNTYGPRQSARAVIPTIISQLIAGRETIELGSLTPERDLTFVGDTVRGFLAVAESDRALGETINVGNGKAITIGDLAQKIVDLVNPMAKIVSAETRVRPEKSEILKLVCANAKARELTGWSPEVTLDDGLARTIEFVRENAEIYRPEEYVV